MACTVLTDKQTNKQTNKKAMTERSPFRSFGVTSLQPIIKERSNRHVWKPHWKFWMFFVAIRANTQEEHLFQYIQCVYSIICRHMRALWYNKKTIRKRLHWMLSKKSTIYLILTTSTLWYSMQKVISMQNPCLANILFELYCKWNRKMYASP